MPDPKIEQQLREYLEEKREERRAGYTNEAIMIAIKRIADDQLTDRQDNARYRRRTRTLEHQVALLSRSTTAVPDWEADPREITGTYQLAAIQKLEKRAAAQDENSTWWRRQSWKWIGTVATGLLILAIAGCAGYALRTFDVPIKRAQ